MSPVQGWHLKERVLRAPQLPALKRCCSIPSWSPSSPLGDLYSTAGWGRATPFQPWSAPSNCRPLWVGFGGQGHGVSCCIAHWSLADFQNSPHVQLSFLDLSTLGVWLEPYQRQSVLVNMPLLQWGFVLQRRVEERGRDTILSLLVTQTFQGLMGAVLSFGRVGPPGSKRAGG